MRIMLVGGGTGGHFYPLIAIAESILANAKAEKLILPELYYIGPEPYDERALFTYGITFVPCTAGKSRRYRSLLNFFDLFKIFWGFLCAIWHLYIIYPDVIMSKGSYTSVPVVMAAWLLHIPIVVHESDAKPGRATKLSASLARYIALSYDDTMAHIPQKEQSKVALTGIPIRHTLLTPMTSSPFEVLGIPNEKPLILVLGGSSGAERINDLIISSLDNLLPNYTILHQTGVAHAQVVAQTARALVKDTSLLDNYFVKGFMDIDTLKAALTGASLIISRAGSTTIYETAIHGKPSILIPIPEDISHDQRTNAYAYARGGAASVMEEKNLTPHLLVSEVARIMNDPALKERMALAGKSFALTNASETLASLLIAIGQEHE